MLVIGLPVHQFLDAAFRTALESALSGVHTIIAGRQIEVAKVKVMSQPTGAYMSLMAMATSNQSLMDQINHGRIVILDPGFFSTDYILIEQGKQISSRSGTTLQAMSRYLEAVAKSIRTQTGFGVSINTLEYVIRANLDFIFVGGHRVLLAEHANAGQAEVVEQALKTLTAAIRSEGGTFCDVLMLTGGGAASFEAATRKAFPTTTVVVPSDPVLCNAFGFWLAGRHLANTSLRTSAISTAQV
jgi:plasmid segregation protein ParM